MGPWNLTSAEKDEPGAVMDELFDPLEDEAEIMKRSRNWDRVGIAKAEGGGYVNVYSKKDEFETPRPSFFFRDLSEALPPEDRPIPEEGPGSGLTRP